jgi:glycosyltransferase involved in cell wall biosynthesis
MTIVLPHTNHRFTLSVVLATRNEEENIARCLNSIKNIADEIIIFDEHSADKTVEISKSFNVKIFDVDHNDNFHITKQKAIEKASGDWILQLDADEVVTPALAKEILVVINKPNNELLKHNINNPEFLSASWITPSTIHKTLIAKNLKLFIRHQQIVEKRDGQVGKPTGEAAAFFIPRMNMFFGKPLVHGGAYPDPSIRLIKRGKARLPAKDVHEIMEVDGVVGWLFNYMEHYDSPTFERYLWRSNRYTDLLSEEYRKKKLPVNFWTLFQYTMHYPLSTFLSLYFRHKAVLDGYPGFVWSFFSALRFPISYFKYLISTLPKEEI